MSQRAVIGGGKQPTAYNLEDLTMLVVDDNQGMRIIIVQMLHALGVRVVIQAVDGNDAFRAMENNDIDLVITDGDMQPVGGLEFVRRLRTDPHCPAPFASVIMLTAHTDLGYVYNARDAGINEYLAKPISPKTLYGRIVSVIENPRTFVRSPGYTGPCRRRSKAEYHGPERRKTDKTPRS